MKIVLSGGYLEINSCCNRKCPYCYNDSNDKGKYLDKNLVYKVIDECASKKIEQITISGGEPFLHPHVYEIIRYINRKGLKAKIITNLSILSLDNAVELLKQGNYLQITIDSVYPEKNDLTRGTGSFYLVERLLKKACEYNLSSQIHLRMNVSRNNCDELLDYIDVAKHYNLKQAAAMLIVKSGRGQGYEAAYDYKESMLEISMLIEKLARIREKCMGEFDFSYSNLQDQRGWAIFSHDDISSVPRIDAEGNVYFCSFFTGEENSLGNIYNESVDEILNSKKARKFFDRIRRRKDNNKCENCMFAMFCMCGCPAVSYMHTNSIKESSDQCSLIKFFLKQKLLGKLE